MKLTIALIIAALLSACTATPEMIAAQGGRCTQIGYKPGTTEHAQCTERGTMQQQSAQNAALVSTGSTAFSLILLDALL